MQILETNVQDALDFSGLEDRVRSNDADTSWSAAQKITPPELSQLKRDIVNIIADLHRSTGQGVTDDAIFDEYRRRGLPSRSPQRLRTARHEITDPRLCQPPLVRELAGELGSSSYGNSAQLWVLTAEAR